MTPSCEARATLRLALQRQFAALRFERADFAQLRGTLPFGVLHLSAQAEQFFGLGLHLCG